MTDQQAVIDALRKRAQEYREQADQIDALADLNAEVLSVGPALIGSTALTAVTAPRQKTKAPTKRRKGGGKTQSGTTRLRSKAFERRPRSVARQEVLEALGKLADGEWWAPVVAARGIARINTAKYRYFRSSWQREAKELVSAGIAEERRSVLPKNGKRQASAVLEYRLKQ